MTTLTIVSLTISRTTFTLLIGVTNAVAVFLAALLPFYLPSAILSPTILFVDAISNLLIIYLTTEEEQVTTITNADGVEVFRKTTNKRWALKWLWSKS